MVCPFAANSNCASNRKSSQRLFVGIMHRNKMYFEFSSTMWLNDTLLFRGTVNERSF